MTVTGSSRTNARSFNSHTNSYWRYPRMSTTVEIFIVTNIDQKYHKMSFELDKFGLFSNACSISIFQIRLFSAYSWRSLVHMLASDEQYRWSVNICGLEAMSVSIAHCVQHSRFINTFSLFAFVARRQIRNTWKLL